KRGLNGRFGSPRLHLVRKRLTERFDRQLMQPFSLHADPLFERWLLHVEAFEELAAIELRGFCDGAWTSATYKCLEAVHVNADGGRVEAQCLTLDRKGDMGGPAERASQARNGLPKAPAGSLLI